MNEFRAAVALVSVVLLLACGSPEATVVISKVNGAPVAPGEHDVAELWGSRYQRDMEVILDLETETEPSCQRVDILGNLESPGDLTAPWPDNINDDFASAVLVELLDSCDRRWRWRATSGTAHIERNDDEVHVTFSGTLQGLRGVWGGGTPGTFDLEVDAVFSTDDLEDRRQ